MGQQLDVFPKTFVQIERKTFEKNDDLVTSFHAIIGFKKWTKMRSVVDCSIPIEANCKRKMPK